MEKRTLINSFGNPYVTVYYDSTIQATVDVWTGPFETEENFRNGLRLVLENIETNRSRKWLADLTQIQGSFEFAKEHIVNEVIPKAMSFGLQYEALVYPNDIFSAISVQEAMQIEERLFVRIFGSVLEAVNWLNAQSV